VRRFGLPLLALLILLGVTSFLGFGPLVLNREGEQRIAVLLGDPVSVIREPGVSITWPFVVVQVFDGRWRQLSTEPRVVQTLDLEQIVVDHYAVWRIADPLQFRRRFPTGLVAAEMQIDEQVSGEVRDVIGRKRLMQVLKEEREAILAEIAEKSGAAAQGFGVEIRDVRINRTELPRATEENVYARMRAERERLARKYRAEGEERARAIRAEADREAQVIVARARRDAEIERGKGDAEAARIYAEAYSQDPDFYAFVRGLEAYRRTLGKDTTLVLSPNHEFFRLFQSGGELPAGSPPPRPPVAAPPPPPAVEPLER
jgi:membrane protease subunit HflC